MVIKEISKNIHETFNMGVRLGQRLSPGDAVLFSGEMGSGKTYFTKGIGKALSITEEIISPTFSIVNEYTGNLVLFHFDLFRIDHYDTLCAIGFFDYVARGREGVIAIEWSENIKELEKEFSRVFKVSINKISDTEREIEIDDCSGN